MSLKVYLIGGPKDGTEFHIEANTLVMELFCYDKDDIAKRHIYKRTAKRLFHYQGFVTDSLVKVTEEKS